MLPFTSVDQGWSRLETSLDNLNSSETWIARHWLHRDKRGSNRSWKSTAESWKSRNVNTRLSIEKVSPPRPNSPESQTIKNENSQKKPSNLKDVWYWWEGNMRVVRARNRTDNMFQDYPSSQKMQHKYNCYTDVKSNRKYVLRLSFVYKYFILTLEKIVGNWCGKNTTRMVKSEVEIGKRCGKKLFYPSRLLQTFTFIMVILKRTCERDLWVWAGE